MIGVALGAALPGHSKYVLALSAGAVVVVISLKRIEVLWAFLLVVGLVGFNKLGNDWTYAEALVVGLVLLRQFSLREKLVIPVLFLAYCGWFLVVAAHTSFSSAERHAIVNYLLPPLLALVTASVARDPIVRRRIVVMLIAATLIDTAVVWYQAGYLQHFHPGTDSVNGTLAASGKDMNTFVVLLPATVCFALALERVWRPMLFLFFAVAMATVGPLSDGKAVLAFVPIAFGAVLVAYWFSVRRSSDSRRALLLLLVSVLLVPVLLFTYVAAYPTGLSSDRLTSLSAITRYFFTQQPGGSLPERGVQLKIAVNQSAAAGPLPALWGYGLGKSNLFQGHTAVGTPRGTTLTSQITATNPDDLYWLADKHQQTSGIWIGQILTETGWIGVLLFLGLIAYTIRLGYRNAPLLPPGSLDRALLVALPGIGVLTLVGGIYINLFFEPPIDLFFWPILGLCIAIADSARRSSSLARGRGGPASAIPSTPSESPLSAT